MKAKKTIFRPSKSTTWIDCRGSLTLPDTPAGAMAKRGIELHGIAEKALKLYLQDQITWNFKKSFKKLKALKDAESGVVTRYLTECASVLRSSRKEYDSHFAGAEVSMASNLMGWRVYGTVDFLMYNKDELKIIDLKTGNTPLTEDHLCQLEVYAILALSTFKKDLRKIKKVELALVTKASGNIRRTYTRNEILDLKNEICEKLGEGNFSFKVGAHCTRCYKFAKCTKANDFVNSTAKALVKEKKETPMHRLLLFESLFKKKMDNVRFKLVGDFLKGKALPKGVWMKEGNRLKYWKDENKLKKKFGKKVMKVQKKLISPAQAIKDKVISEAKYSKKRKDYFSKWFDFKEASISPSLIKPKREVKRVTSKDLIIKKLRKS